jgi:hypothetical protein
MSAAARHSAAQGSALMNTPKPQDSPSSQSDARSTNIGLAFFGLLVGAGGVFSWFPDSYLGKMGLWGGAMIALGSAFALHLLLSDPDEAE